MRLSCRTFAANVVRLQLHALAYDLGNFMRTLAMPATAEPWSLTSLRENLIKIGAKVVSHGRQVMFQMAEVAVPRQMFYDILPLIARLRAPPAPAGVRCDRRRRQRCALMNAKQWVATPRCGQSAASAVYGARVARLLLPRTLKRATLISNPSGTGGCRRQSF